MSHKIQSLRHDHQFLAQEKANLEGKVQLLQTFSPGNQPEAA